jgi:hypothetical protein
MWAMQSINRTAAIIKSKQPFVDWLTFLGTFGMAMCCNGLSSSCLRLTASLNNLFRCLCLRPPAAILLRPLQISLGIHCIFLIIVLINSVLFFVAVALLAHVRRRLRL